MYNFTLGGDFLNAVISRISSVSGSVYVYERTLLPGGPHRETTFTCAHLSGGCACVCVCVCVCVCEGLRQMKTRMFSFGWSGVRVWSNRRLCIILLKAWGVCVCVCAFVYNCCGQPLALSHCSVHVESSFYRKLKVVNFDISRPTRNTISPLSLCSNFFQAIYALLTILVFISQ